MANQEIMALEGQIMELMQQLAELRKQSEPEAVPSYTFQTLDGEVELKDLFAGREQLLLIHNMGQGCRYCTLWADGFNGILPHLESAMSVVLVSKDDPATQRTFARSRGWQFRLASHGGGQYMDDQSVMDGAGNMPGAVIYELKGDQVMRRNSAVFGPGDIYCAMWSLLGLAGQGEAEWTPQFNYWRRPAELDDGGANLLE